MAEAPVSPPIRATRHFVVEWLLLGGALLLIGALTGYAAWHAYADIESRERERLLGQAQVVDANLSRQLDAVSHVLRVLQAELVERMAQPGGVERVGRQLHAIVEAMPSLHALSVLDARGNVLMSTELRIVHGNFRERAYFKAAQADPRADVLYVAPPFRSVLGEFVMTVTRALFKRDGSFAGVVVATLDPEEYSILMRSVRYAPDMGVGLNHEDGTIIMSATHPEVAGQSVAKPGSFFTRHLDSGRKESVFSGTVALTGEDRIVAIVTIKPPALNMDRSLMVAVSRERSALYSVWRGHAYEQLVLYGLLAASTGGGLWWLQRRRRGFEDATAHAARQLADSERTLRTIIESQPQCVSILSPEGRIERINPAGLSMLEAGSEQDVLGGRFADLVAEAQREAFGELGRRINDGLSGSLVFEIIGRQGGRRWLETHAVPMRDAEGRVVGQLGVMQDVTERRRIQHDLERLSQTDALTGLANRRHFMALAEQEVSRTARYGGHLSVLMLDIDHFKSVNDTYGHKVGDAVLKRFAELCRDALREVDVVGRLGGEEFAVLLPQTGAEHAYDVAERLRGTFAQSEISLEQGLPLHFTASIGVATLERCGINLDTLLNHADGALYEAKRAGRNRVRVSAG